MSGTSKTVLAIDPGRAKCGVALVRRTEDNLIQLLWHEITPTVSLEDCLSRVPDEHPYNLVIVGAGTRSRQVVERLRERLPSIGVLVVDETDSTQQARERYWEHNPRRGLRRLLPASLQVPPVPVDDYAALVLAERVLLTD